MTDATLRSATELELHRTVVDGVPVVWTQGPAPLAATLMFGCGTRDESFPTIGVTHMVEHLAMGTLPKAHYPRNASVGLDTTEFVAEGRPDQVVAFLDGVCRALSDLPVTRLDSERGVLEAEGGMATHPTTAAALTQRFGVQGLGLTQWVGPGEHGVSAEVVAEHVGRFFTRANAVLVLTGPPPDGLRLSLPPGERPSRPANPPVERGGPMWCADSVPSPGLGLSAPARDTVSAMAVSILQERLMDVARHEHGISYQVDCDGVEVDADRLEWVLHLDARPGQDQRAAELMWEQATELARHGPTEDELEHERDRVRETWGDPRAVVIDLDGAGRAELFGYSARSRSEIGAARDQVSATDVARALREAMTTAIVVVPEDVEVSLTAPDGRPVPEGGCPRSRTVPVGRVYRPPLLARGMSKEARAARLVELDDGFAAVDGVGDVHTVLFDDVVGVEVSDAGRVLYSRHGCIAPVTHELWTKVAPAIRRVDDVLAPQLRFTAPQRPDDPPPAR